MWKAVTSWWSGQSVWETWLFKDCKVSLIEESAKLQFIVEQLSTGAVVSRHDLSLDGRNLEDIKESLPKWNVKLSGGIPHAVFVEDEIKWEKAAQCKWSGPKVRLLKQDHNYIFHYRDEETHTSSCIPVDMSRSLSPCKMSLRELLDHPDENFMTAAFEIRVKLDAMKRLKEVSFNLLNNQIETVWKWVWADHEVHLVRYPDDLRLYAIDRVTKERLGSGRVDCPKGIDKMIAESRKREFSFADGRFSARSIFKIAEWGLIPCVQLALLDGTHIWVYRDSRNRESRRVIADKAEEGLQAFFKNKWKDHEIERVFRPEVEKTATGEIKRIWLDTNLSRFDRTLLLTDSICALTLYCGGRSDNQSDSHGKGHAMIAYESLELGRYCGRTIHITNRPEKPCFPDREENYAEIDIRKTCYAAQQKTATWFLPRHQAESWLTQIEEARRTAPIPFNPSGNRFFSAPRWREMWDSMWLGWDTFWEVKLGSQITDHEIALCGLGGVTQADREWRVAQYRILAKKYEQASPEDKERFMEYPFEYNCLIWAIEALRKAGINVPDTWGLFAEPKEYIGYVGQHPESVQVKRH